MTKKLPLYQVDAFTNHLFLGNPAAVVITDIELPSDLMQSIAKENNLAETAFVVKNQNEYQIRWFTPTIEVDLCGHATLASAHIIFNHLGYSENIISFSSKSGLLQVRKDKEVLYLNFPSDTIQMINADQQLSKGLGIKPVELYKGRGDYLAVFESEKTILSITPNMAELSKVPARGVIVTSQGSEVDFVSRFFAPQSGIPEDYVTGSAHTTLVPYWSEKLGKRQFLAKQLSERGGELVCNYLGDRIEIGGRAVTYLIGEISI